MLRVTLSNIKRVVFFYLTRKKRRKIRRWQQNNTLVSEIKRTAWLRLSMGAKRKKSAFSSSFFL